MVLTFRFTNIIFHEDPVLEEKKFRELEKRSLDLVPLTSFRGVPAEPKTPEGSNPRVSDPASPGSFESHGAACTTDANALYFINERQVQRNCASWT